MNCPTCNNPMRARTVTTYTVIDGKRWAYEYEEFVCEVHQNQAWQTGEQLQANLDAIKKAKEAAAKLKKATQKK